MLEEGEGLAATHVDLTHMRDIEQASSSTTGVVLLEDASVVDGHLPAPELHHFCTHLGVPVIQRRTLHPPVLRVRQQRHTHYTLSGIWDSSGISAKPTLRFSDYLINGTAILL